MTSQNVNTFRELIERTNQISSSFPRQYDIRDHLIDLVEEVGELAQAILIVEKRKLTNDPAKQRTVEDIANALGDILYELILIADRYELDLDSEYGKVLQELQERVKSGEFVEESVS